MRINSKQFLPVFIFSVFLSMVLGIFVLKTDVSAEEVEPEDIVEVQEGTEPESDEMEPVFAKEEPTEENNIVNESSKPAQSLTGEAGDVTINVEAEEGALPEGTTLKVTQVTDETYTIKAKEAIGKDVTSVSAVDITFYDKNGNPIEPKKDVKVTFASDSIKKLINPVLVHFGEKTEVLPYSFDSLISLVFNSGRFSVYAVVEEGSTEDEARAAVNFYGKDGNKITTVYVKNSDSASELEKIVYDPGAGVLSEGELFKGWSIGSSEYTVATQPKTIEDVRLYLDGLTISEGMNIDIYAMIFKAYNIQFKDQDGVTVHSETLINKTGEAVIYTIETDYTPKTEMEAFVGWNVTTGSDKITRTDGSGNNQPYALGETVNITGNIIFTANPAKGYWLIFKENGDGVTYTAPQFIEEGEKTVRPANPSRYGYTFAGWFDNAEGRGSEFTFGNELSQRKTVYAKWTPATRANYVIIVWKQNVDGESYDFAESISNTGTVGQTINDVKATGSGDNRYASINGNRKQFTGFHLDNYDTNVTINPEGTAVLNVYYNRNQITLTFQHLEPAFLSYYVVIDQTMTGLYGSSLASNGYTWPSEYRWTYRSGNTNTIMTFMDAFIPPDGGSSMTFYRSPNEGDHIISFYKKDKDSDIYLLANTVITSGGTFYITDKYNGYKAMAYRYTDRSEYWSDWIFLGNKDNNGDYASVSNYQNLQILFDPLLHNILFKDGVYVDGYNNPIEGQSSRGELKVEKDIPYESSVASYNKGEANYYEPIYRGYTFAGWYTDDTCTQPYTFTRMPEGITVFAKWIQNQYRVILHPNVPSTDTSLDWGDQGMSFRVDEGNQIAGGNKIIGTRDDYELIGWYTDEACTKPFNFEAYTMSEGLDLLKAYDQTQATELDKYGNPLSNVNKDAQESRFWITKKLDLYAKWRAIVVGAKGINVVYDANGGSNAPTDPFYYLDQAEATGLAASTAPDDKHQFLYWIVQKWNGKAYEDTDVKCYPADTFTVLKNDAKIEDNPKSTGENDKYIYTIQLRAEYGLKDAPTNTHITWHANNGTSESVTDDGLHINEAVDIRPSTQFKYAGHEFIGWAKKADATIDELFLKYENGAFLALIAGQWKTVTKVAADEVEPIDDLYAIWDECFYVYHSGVAGGNIETIRISKLNGGTYDLTQNLTAGTLYGGYYLKDGITTQSAAAYDGTNWVWASAPTANGMKLKPTGGVTYYIKEVPTTYLRPITYVIYNAYKTDDTKDFVNHLYLMINTDDQNYQETGCTVILKDGDITSTITVKTDLTKEFVVTKLHDGKTYTYTAQSKYGTEGYLGLAKADKLLTENAKYIQLPYWITPDGIKVTAAQVLQVSVGNKKLVDGVWGKDGGMSARVLNAKSTLTEA